MKTMQPSDWNENKVRFPCILQPKIDGVRAHTPEGVMLARSNKLIRNLYTRSLYSTPDYAFLDGELAAERETHPELCRLTTSATSTIEGSPFTLWHVFDFLHPGVIGLEYRERLTKLGEYVVSQQQAGRASHLRVIPWVVVNNMEELLHWDTKWLDEGYEGSIIRDPFGKHKQGRSTVKEMGVLRIKRFVDFEFRIEVIVEGQHNGNEAEQDERGYTKRSTHQENMVPNGMVGSLEGSVLADVCDPQTNEVLIPKGEYITVGAGCMSHEDRARYFREQHLLIGQIGKAKMFPKGIKDKPRFPTFQCLRSPDDMP